MLTRTLEDELEALLGGDAGDCLVCGEPVEIDDDRAECQACGSCLSQAEPEAEQLKLLRGGGR